MHDPYETNKISFTVLDTNTLEKTLVDLSQETKDNVDQDMATIEIRNFNLLVNNRLLFTVQNNLIYYDLESHKLIDIFPLEDEEEAIGIWIN